MELQSGWKLVYHGWQLKQNYLTCHRAERVFAEIWNPDGSIPHSYELLPTGMKFGWGEESSGRRRLAKAMLSDLLGVDYSQADYAKNLEDFIIKEFIVNFPALEWFLSEESFLVYVSEFIRMETNE